MTNPKAALPDEYADWVEVPPGTQTDGEYLRLSYEHYHPLTHKDAGRVAGHYAFPEQRSRIFVPPAPKPVLPDVKPGAVISFKSRMGSDRVAIRGNFGWRVFENGASVVYVGMNWAEPIATDADLLNDAGDEGFKLMVNPL